MSTSTETVEPDATPLAQKGLKSGALGLISSTVVGVASTAPAYSLAATLGFVVVAIGLQAPIVTVIAFIPMLFIAYGYKEMNNADPDCGTTFTWGTRAFGPKTGWLGGWAHHRRRHPGHGQPGPGRRSVRVPAVQRQRHRFGSDQLAGSCSSGSCGSSSMTAICYVGIEVSANFQKALLGIELTMLLVLSVVVLVKVGNGTAPLGHLTPALSWFNPFKIPVGLGLHQRPGLLMLFIYWGWDTTVSVNEETSDPKTVPGRAAVLSTVVLLVTYVLVVLSDPVLRRRRDHGHRTGQPEPIRTMSFPRSGTPCSGRPDSGASCSTCCC